MLERLVLGRRPVFPQVEDASFLRLIAASGRPVAQFVRPRIRGEIGVICVKVEEEEEEEEEDEG